MTTARELIRSVGDSAGITKWVRDARIARAGSVTLDGIELPPPSIRLGGHNFQDDRSFLAAAVRDGQRLQHDLGVTTSSRILDIGCGVGRLPIGLRAQLGALPRYTGVDVDAGVIRWCRRHINDPAAAFVHLDLANERYNPSGQSITGSFRLPMTNESFDVIYLYSVFSHMLMPDVMAYLHEFRRLLAEGGTVFLTAFIEEGVDDVAVNPEGYGEFPGEWEGALHCVRFSRGFFDRNVAAAGLEIFRFDHASDTDGQSAVFLRARQ